jgi:hypothetical protein
VHRFVSPPEAHLPATAPQEKTGHLGNSVQYIPFLGVIRLLPLLPLLPLPPLLFLFNHTAIHNVKKQS